MESLGTMYGIGIIFLFILAVLWFFLPFAVFGTQPKIDKLIAEAKRTNELLAEIKAELGNRDRQVDPQSRSHSPSGRSV